jgi:transcription-repair coupling factor (superfamily II helicase)
MPVPLFGWSAGDIVVSIQILYRVGQSFREAGGAKEQYAETAEWLESFANDLECVRDYINENQTAKYTEHIKQQIVNIDRHYLDFEKHLQKYDAGLSSKSTINAVKRAFSKARWAVKELKGCVNGLKAAVSAPILSINMLFSFQNS